MIKNRLDFLEMKQLLVLLSLSLLCCSEPKTAHEINNEIIGKYVYIDDAAVVHTKQKCSAVFKDHSMQVVTPINPEELKPENLKRICSQCVTERQYDKLVSIVDGDVSK